MLQPNIFKNKKMTKYLKWFEFAQKTKNPNNTAADFEKYSNDPILVKVMEKLKTNALSTDDFQYITDYQAHAIGVKNYNDMIAKEASDKTASFYKSIVERAEQKSLRMEQEKQRLVQAYLTQQLRLVDKFLKRGDSLESIESLMEIDRATLNAYIEQLKTAK